MGVSTRASSRRHADCSTPSPAGRIRTTRDTAVSGSVQLDRLERWSWSASRPSSRPVSTAGRDARRTPLRRNMLPVRARRRRRGGRLPAVPAVPARPRDPSPAGSTRPSSCAARCAASPTARSTTRTEDDLATRLGVSARHLRRLFAEHVGATPSEVARSRRAHFARRLLDDTDLPDDADRDRGRVQQRPPDEPGDEARCSGSRRSELRARRRAARPPRRRRRSRAARPVPAAARVGRAARVPRAARDPGCRGRRPRRGVYRRTVELDGAPGVIEVWNVPRPRRRCGCARTSRRLDGSRAPRRAACAGCSTSTPIPSVIDRHLARDPRPAPARARAAAGCASRARSTRSRSASAPILGQQVSVARRDRASRARSSHALRARRSRASTPLGLTHLFPTRRDARRRADLDASGSRRARGPRAVGVRGAIATGRLELDRGAGPRRRRRARSARCPGVGDWTAQYVAMRGCGERDAFPARDLGLRHALGGPRPRTRPTAAWPSAGGRGGRTPADAPVVARPSHGTLSADCQARDRVCPGQRRYSGLRSAPGSGYASRTGFGRGTSPFRPSPLATRLPSQSLERLDPRCPPVSPGTARPCRAF